MKNLTDGLRQRTSKTQGRRDCCPMSYKKERYKIVEYISNFPLKDIVISESFKRTEPAPRKLDKIKAACVDRGELPTNIVINDNNMLIDGYCTYLVALEQGFTDIPVYRGCIELVEAYHSSQRQQAYTWIVPAWLRGKIKAGDRCLVRTSQGVARVKVGRVIRQQEPEQQARKSVLRLL